MKMKKRLWTIGISAAAFGALIVVNVAAQDSGDKITVPFRDAAKPRTL